MEEAKTKCVACKTEMVLTKDTYCYPLYIEGQLCGVLCDNCAERYNNGELEMFIKIEFKETQPEIEVEFDYTDLNS